MPQQNTKELKRVQNVRSGHLAWLTRLLKEVEEAMLDQKNVDLVLQLQEKISVALAKFQQSSQQYVQLLSEPRDIEREIEAVTQQGRGKKELDEHITAWLARIQGEVASSTTYRIPPPSRAESQRSKTPSTKTAMYRQRLELELSQLLRRQEVARNEEDRERTERQKERQRMREKENERQRELLEVQDRLERAQLEDEGSLPPDNHSAEFTGSYPTQGGQCLPSTSPNSPTILNNEQLQEQTSPQYNLTVTTSTEQPLGNNVNVLPQHRICGSRRDIHPQPLSSYTNSSQADFTPINSAQSSRPITHAMQTATGYSPTQPHTTIYDQLAPNGPPRYWTPPGHPRWNLVAPENFQPPQPYQYPPYPVHYGWNQHQSRNHQLDRIVNSLGDMACAFKLGSDLPKPELFTFSGDPRYFFQFKRAFTTIIESKTYDDSLRLHFLIQFCTGKARAAIEHCAMFPDPRQGLYEAKATMVNRMMSFRLTRHRYLKDHP